MTEATSARAILKIFGEDHLDFLQGLVTNDVAKLKDGLVYAALLTPQGKYLADFFMVPWKDAVLLDVDAKLAPGLLQRLGMYKLRANVEIEPVEMLVTRGTDARPDWAFDDPRHPELGWRGYDNDHPPVAADWDAIRVAHLIPETGIELEPNESYILEAGFENLNGVDFKKGCYVGQEVTARMKHKTELRKGLAKVELAGNATAGTSITRDGKEIGRLHTVSGDSAIAYLRFDRAVGELKAGDATVTYAP